MTVSVSKNYANTKYNILYMRNTYERLITVYLFQGLFLILNKKKTCTSVTYLRVCLKIFPMFTLLGLRELLTVEEQRGRMFPVCYLGILFIWSSLKPTMFVCSEACSFKNQQLQLQHNNFFLEIEDLSVDMDEK